MPRRSVLTERQRSALFDLPTDQPTILRHYTLADDDIEHIRTRRHSRNRLGFALQLCTFRYPGRLLSPGETIPLEVSQFIAAQLGEKPDDLSCYAETDVSRDEMMRAANGALRALGAQNRQAMIIAHSDEAHPHVHLLVNRVSPHDGRHLSSSKEKLKLSEWALQYEKERGHILCEERALNAEARERGEYTRAQKDQPRHIFEVEAEARAAANDNTSRANRLRAEERRKDADLSKRSRSMHARHREEWDRLEKQHKERTRDIAQQAQVDKGKAKAEVREAYRPIWRDALRHQRDDMRAFDDREANFLGRVQNTFDAVKLRLSVLDGRRGKAIGGAFRALASSGARQEALQIAHEREKKTIERQQRSQEAVRMLAVEKARQGALEANSERFGAERAALVLAHSADKAKNQAEWRARTAERRQAWERFQQEHLRRPAPRVTTSDRKADQDRRSYVMKRDPDQIATDNAREARLTSYLERAREQEQNNTRERDKDSDRER